MISNPVVAKKISDLMLEISEKIDQSVATVERDCPDNEFKEYRLAAGRILGEVLLEVLNPLYAKHEDLKPPGFE